MTAARKGLRHGAYLWFAGFFGLPVLFATALSWLVLGGYLSSPPFVLVEARTTYLAYTVRRVDPSRLAVIDAILTGDLGGCGGMVGAARRISAAIAPKEDTVIEYAWLPGWVTIRLNAPPGNPPVLETAGGDSCPLPEQTLLAVPAGSMADQLPHVVLGHGEIGAEIAVALPPERPRPPVIGPSPPGFENLFAANAAAPGPVLLSGTARLFGRTGTLLGRGEVFPIGDGEFVLPRGSRLTAPEGAAMAGTLTLSPDRDALDVQVTVDAADLLLFRTGEFNQAEVLAAGAVARAFGDPSLGPILLIVAIVGFVLPVGFGISTLIREAQG